MRIPSPVILLTLLASGTAYASGDAMDRFLVERGLIDPPALGAAPPVVSQPPLPTAPQAGNAIAPLIDSSTGQDTEDQRMSALVVSAMGALGVPYRRGGNGYDSGFDCSGFVRALYEQNFNLVLPRRAAEQAASTQSISREELRPGDLVFFNTLNRAYSHVGIYVGDHRFIHSPRSGAVVRIEDMRTNYWSRRFNGARRVVGQSIPARPQAAATTAYTTY